MAKVTDIIEGPGRSTWEYDITKIPQFKGKKAYVLPGAYYGNVVMLMAMAGFEKADNVDDADVVVFTGGSDVNPELYGQKPIKETRFHAERDVVEKEIYRQCLEKNKVMFGICRGMQFLAIMNGAELWQHVEGHAGVNHLIYDVEDDMTIMATSVHHQMVMLNDDMDVIAVAYDQISKVFKNDNIFIDLNKEGTDAPHELEVEACAYHDTKCFMVQGHPEVGSREYQSWTMTTLKLLMEDWEAQEEEPEVNIEDELEQMRKVLD